jgi:hypothetical protein
VIKNQSWFGINGIIALLVATILACFLCVETILILRGMNPAAIDLHSNAFFIYAYPLLAALWVGIPQFIPLIYRRFPLVHFVVGNLFVLVVLLAIAPFGALLSLFCSEHGFAAVSLTLLHFVLWKQTRIAVKYIVEKDLQAHLKGMIKSYVLLICSVTSILQTMCFPMIHMEYCWVFILILTEMLLTKGFTIFLLKQFLRK